VLQARTQSQHVEIGQSTLSQPSDDVVERSDQRLAQRWQLAGGEMMEMRQGRPMVFLEHCFNQCLTGGEVVPERRRTDGHRSGEVSQARIRSIGLDQPCPSALEKMFSRGRIISISASSGSRHVTNIRPFS
jgi:hypothetical protein